MNNNPYAGIIKELRRESAHTVPLGKVICSNPLRVAYRGVEFDADEILAAEALEAYSVGDTVFVAESEDGIIVLCKLVGGEDYIRAGEE